MAKSDWNAADFFSRLLSKNKLAKSHVFNFFTVSGLDGFEEALSNFQNSTAMLCVSDINDGYTQLNNHPWTRRVKTVFLAMRHPLGDMKARSECMEIMRELFRQMMSVLIMQKTQLAENNLYLDERITFNEIDYYFFNGAACAFFNIGIDVMTDLRFNADEWDE